MRYSKEPSPHLDPRAGLLSLMLLQQKALHSHVLLLHTQHLHLHLHQT